ncbi:cyclic peptide export ABC transporter [Pseudoalteromonas sp. 2CM41L]|uniref:cyclic peptide export ABC transporter n=1 Tax=Pseudoalteromonas sp. 2CM41L TaxID=2929857 RepID=UPI0020BE1CB1|nr:cyclic peptide export ABC transporter [Pseudoalteromonas sp. 2CM41L]MCK8108981.1 cyclic peptide export ABC transporter [Pseudoalteromonas sp. 2CM41L]
MSILGLFSKHAPNKTFISIGCGILAGGLYSLLIPLVMLAIEPRNSGIGIVASKPQLVGMVEITNTNLALFFLAVCTGIVFLRTLSQVLLARVGLNIVSSMRKDLYTKISNSYQLALENVGKARLNQLFTTDIQRIVIGARALPEILVNLVTLIGLLMYLMLLNMNVFWYVIGAVLFGVIAYQIPVMFSQRLFLRARHELDSLQTNFIALIEGSMELKVNNKKREDFFNNNLLVAEDSNVSLDKKGQTIIQLADNCGDMIGFLVIGMVSFVIVNYESMSMAELTAVVMTLMYITGPVATLMNVFPAIVVSRISLQQMELTLKEIEQEQINRNVTEIPEWQSLRLNNISFAYDSFPYSNRAKSLEASAINDRKFSVGPISLEVRKGEITFILGGNGSGKTTLSKLISLHYLSESGDILFDDVSVDKNNLISYRQGIACVFSDYYLFENLLGVENSCSQVVQDEVTRYLELLELSHKVSFDNGRFSTLDLSDGQRRRLALLVAFMDDKELYIFDEWAADQDPQFKDTFYQFILPALRSKGKAVVAITHDDRYFDMADKIIELENGRLNKTFISRSDTRKWHRKLSANK